MPMESHDIDLPATVCRFSRQGPGFSIYISAEIANEVLEVLPLKKKFVAVLNKDEQTLTIQRLRI